MIAFRSLAALGCQLGESPVWDERRDVLVVRDVLAPALYQALDGTVEHSWRFHQTIGSFAHMESGRPIVALGRDIVLFDPETGTVTHFARTSEPDSNRLNGGKVGPDGCFYVGSMDDRAVQELLGVLYRVSANGSVEPVASGFKVSNGLAWSPDGTRLYHSDSRGPTIDCYAFEPETGALSDRCRFAILDEAPRRPAGGACDSEGFYWSAGVSAGVLNRFAPDRMLCRAIRPLRVHQRCHVSAALTSNPSLSLHSASVSMTRAAVVISPSLSRRSPGPPSCV